MTQLLSASDHITSQPLKGAARAVEGAWSLKVPIPLLIMLLMVLVILSVLDILKKSYDVHEEANYRVAKAALEITLSRTQSGLNGIASRIATDQRGFDEALPEVFFNSGDVANKDLSGRTLFLAFDREGRLLRARHGHRILDSTAVAALATQPALSELFASPAGENRQANPLLVTVDSVPFILSDPQPLEGAQRGGGAVHVAVALPVRDLLFDELEKYEVFGSDQLRSYLDRKNDLSSLTDLIVSLQNRNYAKFHFKAVVQITIVLVAFVISIMIGHHIDRKNDDLRRSRDIISEREQEAQRLRREAEQASEAKTRFIQNMSHELRTPLNAVIGFSEIMEKELLGPLGNEQYVSYVKDIHGSGHHLLKIINDILDVAKIEASGHRLCEEELDPRGVLEAGARLIAEDCHKAQQQLKFDLPETLPRIYADERMIKQVILNLLSNATKFTPEGGNIELTAEVEADGSFIFVVKDSGIGIAEDDIDRAFAPFQQIDSRLSRKFEGTGLGLPLSRGFMRLHGGDLVLESKPGTGTVAIARLPSERVIHSA